MRSEGIQLKKEKLSHVRASLGLSQRALAAKAGLSQVTISSAERGDVISKISAFKMLNAINAARREKRLLPFRLEDIDWKVEGE